MVHGCRVPAERQDRIAFERVEIGGQLIGLLCHCKARARRLCPRQDQDGSQEQAHHDQRSKQEDLDDLIQI